jgi:hypothetical protein
VFSALATLPSLENAIIGLANIEDEEQDGPTLQHPEALTRLFRSPSLRMIEFKMFHFADKIGRAMTEAVRNGCIATVNMVRGNTCLERLDIETHGISADSYLDALEKLHPNKTLKTLCLHPNLESFSDKEIKRLISIVKENYGLEALDENVTVLDLKRELGAILRLNRAGRRYMIQDAGSIAKGVEVLSDVSDDLDCVFLHLLENPLLCDIACRDIEAATDAHRKKRQHSSN